MGNSESSSQLTAGADSRRGVVRSRKSEEENDATPSSVAVRAAVKVGTVVARAVLMAWGVCCSANSPRSEHPIKDDRRRHDMLAAAGDIRVGEMFGGGRESIAGGGPDLTVALHGPGLTVAEDRLYQQFAEIHRRPTMLINLLFGVAFFRISGNSRGGRGDGVGHTTEGGGIGGGGGGGDSSTTEGAGVGGEGGPRRRRTRPRRRGAEKEEKKKWTVVKVAVAQQRGAAKEEKGAEASTRRQGRRRQQAVGEKNGGNSFPVGNRPKSAPRTITFMTYNVWKQEGTDLQKRIRKLGHLVGKDSPDVIFFQEVTPNIKRMFQTLAWWNDYYCSDSSENAIEGDFCVVLSKFPIKAKRCVSSTARKLPGCELNVGNGRRLYVANGHLKRPNPPGMHCEIRKTQAKEAMKLLNCSPNAVFGGDMNWDEHRDGQFPLPKRWVDAWTRLKPNNNGWTYDTKSNESLKGRKLVQKRLDRFVCKLKDFTLKDIKIIGNDAEPPSDHYGLLLTICYK